MYKRLLVVLTVLSVLGVSAMAETWSFDKAHSSIGFSVRHMVISKTRGTFGDFDGTVNFDGANLEKGAADITIQMASINTENDARDNHLRSADFFDVEKFPTMTFKSKKITAGKDNSFIMTGDLTMKGVTREVRIECELNGTMSDPKGGTRAGFSGSTTINRQDFGVSFNSALADGSLVVGNDVDIQLEIELIKNQ